MAKKHVFECISRYPNLRVVWPTNGTATIQFAGCRFETDDDELAAHLDKRPNIKRVKQAPAAGPVLEGAQPEKRGPGRPRKEG